MKQHCYQEFNNLLIGLNNLGPLKQSVVVYIS